MSRGRDRGVIIEGLIMPMKIRKRGCSSSSSSSSRIRNHRLNKRAGKTTRPCRLGGSRSNTPVPTWRTVPLKSGVESPKCSQSGRSTQPVSARRLAAILWGMNGNGTPSPESRNRNSDKMKSGSKMVFKMEKMLSPRLSDPSHSPALSEIDRSGSRQRTPSISRRLRSGEQNATLFNSTSDASLIETEMRSHAPTPRGSETGGKNRLNDLSNAITTSKELVKIINRLWARSESEQPSSSLSVISALHAELERARLQVDRLVKEQYSDQNEITCLVKCFAEEKASWKVKERAVEEAIEAVRRELEVERKLRRQVERLNKKLGDELSDLKSSFAKAVDDVESERRAREITEQVCGELAKNIAVDKPVVVDVCEEKNSAIKKLRKQLEIFLGTRRDKDGSRAASEQIVDADDSENKDDSGESDGILSKTRKSHRWSWVSGSGAESRKLQVNEIKARSSISGQVSRRSTSVLDGVDCRSGDGFDRGRLRGIEGVRRMGLRDDCRDSSDSALPAPPPERRKCKEDGDDCRDSSDSALPAPPPERRKCKEDDGQRSRRWKR
ncbi:uncharacterized protein LOC127240016 isoform X2 [Andrographis paniculata]|uniref:uncharacterized protein LOC127240016 isoform X2 n=1 Tax=Andrographis paniculata TaxID=175694 RepID=UPI0021E8CBE0|nr:uncharacterized protein LOC127240016 isoform X2 [Andrographis paniculata]